jgi:hypothetical protein
MKDMQHRHLFVNSLLPHLKYTFETTKFSNSGRGSVGSLTTRRESIPEDRSINRGVEGGSKEFNISIEPEHE